MGFWALMRGFVPKRCSGYILSSAFSALRFSKDVVSLGYGGKKML